MKCPKCGYHSFDHLDSCKKCSKDLAAHKAKFNLRGFFSPGPISAPESAPVADEGNEDLDQSAEGSIDFGFDFLKDDEESTWEPEDDSSPGDNNQAVSIDQDFAPDSESDSDDKPKKGPEFAF